MSMNKPPTPPSDAARANLALLLSPAGCESEEAAADASPFVDEVGADEPELVTGRGVGDVDEDTGVMAKVRVELLLSFPGSVEFSVSCTWTCSTPFSGGVPEISIVVGSK